MALRTYGTMAVDWEQRTDFDRLRRERLARATEHLERSELGALLCFDMANIRYITATHIGTWAIDKLSASACCRATTSRSSGTSARRRATTSSTTRGSGGAFARGHLDAARRRSKGRAESVAEKIRVELEQRGLLDEPVGVDVIELPCCSRCRRRASTVVDGQALMQDVRMIKTAGRDHAAQHGVRDGRLRLRRPVPRDEAGLPRERLRRARQQGAVRARLGARRGRQRDLGRALQPASARLHRPHAAPRRPGVLRHPPRLQRLSHVLLPHVRRRLGIARARRRVRALPRHPRQRDLA